MWRARTLLAREEGASGARGRESAQAEKSAENRGDEEGQEDTLSMSSSDMEEGGCKSNKENEDEGRSGETDSSMNQATMDAVAAVFVAGAAKKAAGTTADDGGGGDGGRKKGKADVGGACSSGANAVAVLTAEDVPAATAVPAVDGVQDEAGAGKTARSVEGLVDTDADTDPGADVDADADADPDAGGGAVGGRRGGVEARDREGDDGGRGQTAEEMGVCSVVSEMEEGGDNEDDESDGEEVEMTGPLEGRSVGETKAMVKSKGARKESSRLTAKRKAEKDKEVEKRRVKTSGGAAKGPAKINVE